MNKEIQAINELGWLDPPGSVSRLRDFERMAFQKYGLPNRMLPCRKSRRTLGEFEERY
jgi:hypothetical protein